MSGLVVSKPDSQLEGRGLKSHPILVEMVSKPCQDLFLHPILVHYIEKKENTGNQIGHSKKY